MGTFSIALETGILAPMDIYQIRKKNLIRLIGNQRKGACAERWGMNPAHLSQILSDRTNKNLGDDVARRIESIQKLDRGWLDNMHFDDFHMESQGGERRRAPEPNAELLGPIDAWDDDTPLEDDEVYVPFLKEVELSAGKGRTVVEQSSNRKLRFGKLTLHKQNVQASEAVCVTVNGNSMEPVLPNGSTVGVDQGMTNVIDGKMYALNHDGHLRVKLLYRLPGGGIRVRSYNRDEHPDEEYSAEQMVEKQIIIIGKVFWYSVLV